MLLKVGLFPAPLRRFSFLPHSRIPRFSFLAISLSIATLAFTIQPMWASTTTTLAMTSGGNAATTIFSGSVLTLTATVNAGASPVTRGQVNFCDAMAAHCTDVHILGSAQITNAGTAVYRFVPGIGTHSYKAMFVGTNTNSGSSSPAQSLTVTGLLPTQTYVGSEGTPGNYTLFGEVQALKSTNRLTGGVSFSDASSGNRSLGSGAFESLTTNNAFGINFSGSVATSSSAGGLSGTSAAAGDFNGDGKSDLVVPDRTGNLGVALGAGDGTFSALPNARFDASVLGGKIVVGDFNGDGKADLASLGSSNHVGVLLGSGNGTFIAMAEPAIGAQPTDIAVGDWNGDGIVDLAVATSGNITILLGNGDGTFHAVTSDIPTATSPQVIAAADFNGDGKLDLAVLTSDSTVTVFTGNGDGTFSSSQVITEKTQLLSLVAGDFDGDGKPDLAVGAINNGSGAIAYLLIYSNKGGILSGPTYLVAANNIPGMMVLADFDGDGNADIGVAANPLFTAYEPQMNVNFGDGKGNFGESYDVAFPATSAASSDFNGDGYPDILSFYATYDTGGEVSSPILTFSSPYQTLTVTLDNVSISGVGAHQIEASYAGDAFFAASNSSTTPLIAKTVPPTLTLTATPGTSIYGQQVVLSATLNPSNVPSASTNSEPVKFLINGSLLGIGTLNNGVATLNLTSLPVGTDSLSATYVGDTNFLPTSGTATVTVSTSQALSQTIAFNALPNTVFGVGPITLTATASSGLPVSYNVTGPAIVSGSTLTIRGAGTILITATQAGDAKYAGAPPVTQNLTVSKAILTVTATDEQRLIGAANPTFTYTVSGFVNGDSLAALSGSATLTSTATSASPSGIYPITLAASTLSAANYTFKYVAGTLFVSPTTPECEVIDQFSNGFTYDHGLFFNGGATVGPNFVLQLTDGQGNEARSAFLNQQVYIDAFTTDFTFQLLDANADGFAFVVQRDDPTAVGQGGGGLGYAGIKNSAALKFDLHNNNGEGVDSTGLYFNGAAPTTPSLDLAPFGIDLHSGHIFAVHFVYVRGIATLTITDTVTKVSAAGSAQVGMDTIGTTAYVGFTAGTGANAATQNILNWTYSGGSGCGANQ